MNLSNRVWFEFLWGLQTLQRESSLEVLAETIYYVNLFKWKEKVISPMSSRRIKNMFWLEVGKMTHHDPAFFMVAEFVYKMSVFSDEEIDNYLKEFYPQVKIQQNFRLLLSFYKQVQEKHLKTEQEWIVSETAGEIALYINDLLEWISVKQNWKHFLHASWKEHVSARTKTFRKI